MCSICNEKHNILLHREQIIPYSQTSEFTKPQASQPASPQGQFLMASSINPVYINKSDKLAPSCLLTNNKTIILSTAIVLVSNAWGGLVAAKCILDSGSQSHFMTVNFANRLGLKTQRINAPVSGLGGNTTTVRSQGQTRISNGNQSFSANLNFLIVSKITDIVPTTKLRHR